MDGVEIRGLRKVYGMVEVIQNLDLTIHDGEFVALVGPSGCGKSTLLRVIAGLEDATAGDVSIGGVLVNDVNPRDRNIAMVFQSYALYPHMTVAENMGFSLKLARRPKAEARALIEKAAAMLDLTDYLDRRPAQLSGGQRQRVAMGRALVREPAVFLFDEPLSNLDAKLRVQMRMEIKALHQAVRKTSIYVTHDQIEAMTLADRIVVLNKGRIEQQGTPLELYSRPCNLFVAGFIGSPTMNLLTATARVGAGGAVAELGDGTKLKLSDGLALTDGQAITLGIRPQHLTRNGSGEQLAGNAVLVEPTGSETHVTIRVAGEVVTAAVNGEEIVGVGEPFSASVPADYIHVFDTATTQRVQSR